MAYKIESRIGIAAPVDDVYDIVSDIDNWPTWSPIHKSASARLSFGAPFATEENFEGLGVWEITGTISDWSPLSHIHVHVPKPFYAGTLIRYFEFDSLTETSSTFTIGAQFNGFLSEREGKAYAKFLRIGFAAFTEALKARAEAQFAENPVHRAPKVVKERELPKLGPTKAVWSPPKFFGYFKKK